MKTLITQTFKAITVPVFSALVLASCSSATLAINSDSPSSKITLAPCPGAPNCVCSEFSDNVDRYIAPLAFKADPNTTKAALIKAIEETGGELINQSDTLITATYTSSFFGFIDDVEFRLDKQNFVVHVRSESRVGYYDFGANRDRVEAITEAYSK